MGLAGRITSVPKQPQHGGTDTRGLSRGTLGLSRGTLGLSRGTFGLLHDTQRVSHDTHGTAARDSRTVARCPWRAARQSWNAARDSWSVRALRRDCRTAGSDDGSSSESCRTSRVECRTARAAVRTARCAFRWHRRRSAGQARTSASQLARFARHRPRPDDTPEPPHRRRERLAPHAVRSRSNAWSVASTPRLPCDRRRLQTGALPPVFTGPVAPFARLHCRAASEKRRAPLPARSAAGAASSPGRSA